jgi:DNA-directed RNA polymerase specialized sigma subunit
VESKDPNLGRKIMDAALEQLEDLTIVEIRKAYSEWRLVDMLTQTRLTEKTRQAVIETVQDKGWQMENVRDKLVTAMQVLENRNRKIASAWSQVILN